MWRKILIINLLVVLGLNPVAHAVSPLVAPADSHAHAHNSMIMDCGQTDPAKCVDFDSCISGSHASCDAQSKSPLSTPVSTVYPRGQLYASPPAERYLSHHAKLLLRPPRAA